jgi:hypothetical protein
MQKWKPSKEVEELILRYPRLIRGRSAVSLYSRVTFYLTNFYKNGITLSDKIVLLDNSVPYKSPLSQASIIFHELVHVAQYLHYGWIGFMGTYIGQWIRGGFSYEKMKEKGLENEAYALQKDFTEEVRQYA